MAIMRQCDRCKATYKPYNYRNNEKKINGINLLNLDNEQKYWNHGPYDLCPVCSDKLIKWLFKDEALEE